MAEKSESKSLLQRNYYDHPEGEDIIGKMIATNKYALAVGIGFSTVDVLLYSHTKGYLATLARYAKFTGPLLGVASAFTLGTFMTTRLRGKDDTYVFQFLIISMHIPDFWNPIAVITTS